MFGKRVRSTTGREKNSDRVNVPIRTDRRRVSRKHPEMTPPDRRVQRTRSSLRGALYALLQEVPYDGITVQRILDRANVGRSTFYTHFAGKDDLLLSGLDELQAMLEEAHRRERTAADPAARLVGFSRAMFDHVDEFRQGYLALVSARVWPTLRQRVEEILAELVRRGSPAEMRRLERRRPARSAEPEMPVELFVHWITSSFMAVLTWWIDEKSRLTPAEIDERFRALVVPTCRSLLT